MAGRCGASMKPPIYFRNKWEYKLAQHMWKVIWQSSCLVMSFSGIFPKGNDGRMNKGICTWLILFVQSHSKKQQPNNRFLRDWKEEVRSPDTQFLSIMLLLNWNTLGGSTWKQRQAQQEWSWIVVCITRCAMDLHLSQPSSLPGTLTWIYQWDPVTCGFPVGSMEEIGQAFKGWGESEVRDLVH